MVAVVDAKVVHVDLVDIGRVVIVLQLQTLLPAFRQFVKGKWYPRETIWVFGASVGGNQGQYGEKNSYKLHFGHCVNDNFDRVELDG